jgi:hypothetical protein
VIFVSAHVAGMPVEETLLYAGPALSGAVALFVRGMGLAVRRRLHRLRRPPS